MRREGPVEMTKKPRLWERGCALREIAHSANDASLAVDEGWNQGLNCEQVSETAHDNVKVRF